jgi:hypothetical protein
MTEYWLHFVGKNLYSREKFVKEAKRYGVNRAIQGNILKYMKWGDIILLAEPIREKPKETLGGVIFGYFTITTVTPLCPDELKEMLNDELKVVSVDDTVQEVVRECGSYTIGSAMEVEDSINEIVTKTEKLAKAFNYKVKWFVGGPLTLIPDIQLVGAKQHLGYKKVELDLTFEELKGGVKKVVFISGYKQRWG